MKATFMTLKILLPTGIFMEQMNITRVIAESEYGSFGLLPHRFDCLASLVPGILSFGSHRGDEKFIAIDEGVLVKTGLDVVISVRNAIGGDELKQLHRTVKDQFLNLDLEERNARKTMAKMESSFIKRLVEMKK